MAHLMRTLRPSTLERGDLGSPGRRLGRRRVRHRAGRLDEPGHGTRVGAETARQLRGQIGERRLAIDEVPEVLVGGRRCSEIAVGRLGAVVDDLPPVLGRRVMPAQVAADEDLTGRRDRAGEAVPASRIRDRIVVARRDEVGHEQAN